MFSPNQKFNLVKYFSVTSSVAFLVLLGVLSFTYRTNEIGKMITTTEYQNVVLAQSFANSMWTRFAPYVNSVSGLTGDELRARPETAQLDRVVRELTFGLPILKVKIYNLSGLTVYSSEQEQMGVDKSNNLGFLASAREGKPKSKLTHRDTFPAFSGEVFNVDLVESYLPIRTFDGSVEGVFEIYFDATKSIDTIDKKIVEAIVFLVIGFGALYLILHLIVTRADRIIQKQYGDLQTEITKHEKTLEQLIYAKDRAEVANKAKSEFLSSMSHELRTPMNAIIGFSETIKSETFGPIGHEKYVEYIGDIFNAGHHLLELINDVLDLAKIEADQVQLFMDDIDSGDIIDGSIGLILQNAASRSISVINRTKDKPASLIRADALRLKQALLNILSNAIKYNQAGGTITLETHETGDGYFRISITDTGIGIHRKHHKRIFKPFDRLGVEAVKASEGTGIGLTVTKQLLEKMGGRIGFESEEGKGSTFWIEVLLSSESRGFMWKNDLKVGIKQVDDDHEILFTLLNRITDHNLKKKEVDGIVGELIEYTLFHFQREEAIMAACDYPHLDDHRKTHRQLAAKVNQFAEKCKKDEGIMVVEELIGFLRSWLIDHILKEDKDIHRFTEDKEMDIDRMTAEVIDA